MPSIGNDSGGCARRNARTSSANACSAGVNSKFMREGDRIARPRADGQTTERADPPSVPWRERAISLLHVTDMSGHRLTARGIVAGDSSKPANTEHRISNVVEGST